VSDLTQQSKLCCLTITEDEFDRLYPDLKGHYSFFNNPPPATLTKDEFEKRYLKSKLWRLNNVYTIINKDGDPVTFRMNFAQHKVYAASRNHPRVIILKSRQQGISTFWLVSYFDDSMFCPYFNVGLMAQGTDEAATLLERTKFLWDMVDPQVKEFLGITLVKDNTKEFSLSNKSTIFIRVSFRSTTLQRLHISEFGKIANANPKRAKETKTGTLQALGKGNTGAIESTAEGKNMFKQMWDDSVIALHSNQLAPKDFYPVFLSWLDDPDCRLDVFQTADEDAEQYFRKLGVELTQDQRNFWISQRRELGGDIFQEYPATPEEAFTASKDGTYYARLFNEHVVRKGRLVKDVYDPNLPVDVYFDLGVDDYTVMAFVQWHDGQYRIIHEYWNNGFALVHYLEYVADTEYDIRALRFPHDIKVREQGAAKGNGRAKSRLEVVQEWKKENHKTWRLDTLTRTSIEHGIEAVRRMIPQLSMDVSCTYLTDCCLNYSKEWDDKLQVWKKTPLHNEYSHGADVLRQIASVMTESKKHHESRLAKVAHRRSSGYAL